MFLCEKIEQIKLHSTFYKNLMFEYKIIPKMAKPTLELVEALRQTANNLKNGAHYAWGNHGACNCGNLLQTVAHLSKEEILTYAHAGIGEWTELAVDFCPVSNTPIDLLIKKLQEIGLTPTDIHHLEYLDDRAVLNNISGGFRWLKRNEREDVITYFESFALLLEEAYLAQIRIPYPPEAILELFEAI